MQGCCVRCSGFDAFSMIVLSVRQAPVAAALAAAHKRRQEAADAGDSAGFGLMTPGRLAAEKQALRAREAALKEVGGCNLVQTGGLHVLSFCLL